MKMVWQAGGLGRLNKVRQAGKVGRGHGGQEVRQNCKGTEDIIKTI